MVAKRMRITSDLDYNLGEISSLCTYNTTAITNVYLKIIQCLLRGGGCCLGCSSASTWIHHEQRGLSCEAKLTTLIAHTFILMSSTSEEPVASMQDLPMERALVAINDKTIFSKWRLTSTTWTRLPAYEEVSPKTTSPKEEKRTIAMLQNAGHDSHFGVINPGISVIATNNNYTPVQCRCDG